MAEKHLVRSWGKLWPEMKLLDMYKHRKEDNQGFSENDPDGNEVLTTEDVTEWLTGDARENHQMLTDDESVEDIGAEGEEEPTATSLTPTKTIGHNTALDA